jgi:hypothetical protein
MAMMHALMDDYYVPMGVLMGTTTIYITMKEIYLKLKGR